MRILGTEIPLSMAQAAEGHDRLKVCAEKPVEFLEDLHASFGP
jgi:hypothetical protein